MRIVYVLESFPQISETFTTNEIWNLVERGHEVAVEARLPGNPNAWQYGHLTDLKNRITVGEPGNTPEVSALGAGLRRACPYPIGKHPKHWLARAKCAWRVTDLVRRIVRHKPDAMVVHFGFDNAIAAAIVAERYGIPRIQWLHGSDYYELPHRSLIWMTEQPGQVMTPSIYAMREVRALGVTAPIDACNLGIDLDVFRPDPAHPKETHPTVICVARLGHNKNQARLFRIFAEARQIVPEARLWLVGTGPEEANLKILAASMGLQDSVIFHGAVLADKLLELLRRAWIKTLLSDKEGLGVALMEAMACGTPCMASNLGGCPEVVTDGQTGVLIDWNQPNAEHHAAERMAELLTDAALRHRYAEAGLEDARSRFSETVHTGRIEEHLRRLTQTGTTNVPAQAGHTLSG